MPTKLRNNIKKRVRETRRRSKKEARKLAALGIKTGAGRDKELHIPNLYPYKKKMIEHLVNSKQTTHRKKLLEKLALKEKTGINMEVIKEDSDERVAKYLERTKVSTQAKLKNRKHFMKELRNVIDSSDIILEVLDARDPMGCRCKELEAEALGSGNGKKVILVLNKIDLVPM